MAAEPKFEVIGPKSNGLSLFHHVAAGLCAFVFAALAFALPVDSVNRILEPPGFLDEVIQVTLPLPEATHLSDFQAPQDTLLWQTTTVEPGDNLDGIFRRLGLEKDDLYSLMSTCREAKELKKILPGQVFKIRTDGDGDLVELVQETVPLGGTRIFREGKIFKASKYKHEIEKRRVYKGATVTKSFRHSLKAADLSTKIITQLDDIFSRKINLSSKLKSTASFALIYEEDYFSGEKIGDGDVLAVELTLADKTYRAIGFRSAKNKISYYDIDGRGMRELFLRYPVRYKRISGRFNPNRRHPVLGVKRPHWGADFAAAHGTPIVAAADATVKSVGRQRGYGKTVVLDHGNKRTTLYAHMSRYKKGLNSGSKIKKGEVIGYIGQTGLATGPHLHYEYRINNVPRDPLAVALPTANPIPKRYRAQFRQYSQNLLAQLELQRRTQLALNR